MRIFKASEIANREPVVNMSNFGLMAVLTDAATARDSGSTCGLPADAIGAGWATLPSRMSSADIELGLPFRHASVIAKYPITMKVAFRAIHVLTTPITVFGNAVAAPRVLTPNFSDLRALPTTHLLVALAGAGRRFATYHADRFGSFTPAGL